MHILFIEPCKVNYGGYYRAYNICLSLSKKDIKVDLLCAHEQDFSLSIKLTKINDNFNRYELPRFNFHFYFSGRLLRAFIALFFGLFKKYDLTHAFVPTQLESNIPACLLKLLGKKVVMDWDDYWEDTHKENPNKIIKAYLRFCEMKAPSFFNNIIVVSEFLYQLARIRGATNVLKLINGVNTHQFQLQQRYKSRNKLSLNKDGKYLLAFGNTYFKDRFVNLIIFFKHIIGLDSKVILLFNHNPLHFINDYKLRKTIYENCLKSIINVGQIKENDLGYYLAAADATLFLTNNEDYEKACFPIRIGSYLNGESIIIMNEADTEAVDTLRKYNSIIIDKDLAKLARKTVVFLNNKTLQQKMRQKVKIAKKELSWDILIKKLIDYYKEILNENNLYT